MTRTFTVTRTWHHVIADTAAGALLISKMSDHDEANATVEVHTITIDGPIAYPGGKDGLYQASCSAGDWVSDFDTETAVAKSGAQHVQSREPHE